MGEGDPGQISPDGKWYWDSQKWLSTLSPDGKTRWNGASWVAVTGVAVGRGKAASPKAVMAIGGGAAAFVVAIAVAIAAIGSAGTSNAPSSRPNTAQLPSQAASQSPTPSAAAAQLQASPEASPSPVASPSPSPSPQPTPKASPVAAPKPPPPPPPSTCGAPANPWGYNFCSGSVIYSTPATFCSYFACIANFPNGSGYVMECSDGTYSRSGGISGSCSHHGGNLRPLRKP